MFHLREKLYKIVEAWDPVINKREWLSQLYQKSFPEKLVGAACLHGLMFTTLNLVHSWLQLKMRASMGHELVDTFGKMIIDQVRFFYLSIPYKVIQCIIEY